MHASKRIQIVLAASTIGLFAGCSNNGSSAPLPIEHAFSDGGTRHIVVSFDSCPASGPIKYVSGAGGQIVYIFAGKFAGQAPCGQIGGFSQPLGMFVAKNHDLYVANVGGGDILVFHRGQTTPYNTYTDPTAEYPWDVAVTKDGTVVATNIYAQNTEEKLGSLSTWIAGPNGGTFVGNFKMTTADEGGYIAVRDDGTIFYDQLNANIFKGQVWKVKCPAGACGTENPVSIGFFNTVGGLAFDATGDLLVTDAHPGTAYTFELPNPNPKTFPLNGTPNGMAINAADHHWYVANQLDDYAAEYSYPGGTLIGTVEVSSPDGVAVDPGRT
jgi:predicted secreted protein